LYVGCIDEESAPTNQADRWNRRFIELFTTGERERWLAKSLPEQVTRGRSTGALASTVEKNL